MNKGKKTNDFPFTDEELRVAAAKAEEKLMEQYDDLEGYTYTFSDEFEQTMDRFFRKIRRRSQVFEATKRVAAVFAAAVIVAGAWLTFDVNARASVFDWMKSVYEDKIVYLWGGDQESEVLPKYELTWLPDGFEKVDEAYTDSLCSIAYSNPATEDIVVFEYQFVNAMSHMQLNEAIADSTYEKIELFEKEADFYCANNASDTNNLYWFDEQQTIAFNINSSLDKTAIIRIAESLHLLN